MSTSATGSGYWTDEKLFVINFKSRARKVYVIDNEQYQEYFSSTSEPGNVRLMVWGCFSLQHGLAPLVIMRGKQNSSAYIARLKLYKPWFTLHTAESGVKPVFMQDNCGYHASMQSLEFLADFLDSIGFNIASWPSRSPDFNPIELLWADLQRLVVRRAESIRSQDDLEAAISDAVMECSTPEKLEGYVRHAISNMQKSYEIEGGMKY